MIKAPLILAFLGLLTAMNVEDRALWTTSNGNAAPGALSASLNTTSINNIMQTFVPILAYF